MSENEELVLFGRVMVFKHELDQVRDEEGYICLWADALIYDILQICGLLSRASELIEPEALAQIRGGTSE